MGAITEHNMAPLYVSVCKVGRGWNTVSIDTQNRCSTFIVSGWNLKTSVLMNFYYILPQDLKWQVDGNLLAKMEANNKVRRSHFSISLGTVHNQLLSPESHSLLPGEIGNPGGCHCGCHRESW